MQITASPIPTTARVSRIAFTALVALGWGTVFAAEPDHPGQAVFEKHCAVCHDNPQDSRARTLDTMRETYPAFIESALREGKMKAQGALLSEDELADLMDMFLGQTRQDDNWVADFMCPAHRAAIDTSAVPTVSTFGLGHKNHRRLTAEQAGLSVDDMGNLELAWSVAFPNVTMMRSQPAIVGNTLFITPVDSRLLYAFDIAGDPCVKWIYQSDRSLRSALTYGILPESGRAVLVFGDMEARVHTISAQTGELIWQQSLRHFPESIITGTPQLADGKVFASVSQYEIMLGAQPDHECCKTHGAVAALDGETGEIIWFTSALPDATEVRDRGDGQMIWGPSGAPIWTSPAIDLKRGVLYVGTGEATSEPAHPHTDAILAVDLEDGHIRWAFNATANDIYLAGCWGEDRSPNCPPEHSVERDVDFGASVIIAQLKDGSDILLAGQKSSDIWALDPDKEGAVIWRWNNGLGAPNGGIHWGMAYDGETVYAGIADTGRPRPGFNPVPGFYAVDVETGRSVWSYRAEPACEDRPQDRIPRCQFMYGYSAAAIVIDTAVATGTLDGFLKIFDSKTGQVLFSYDTVREFHGINGVSGHGGAIDNASIVAANGTLFVSSGYSMHGQPSGNVLLAFRPRQIQ